MVQTVKFSQFVPGVLSEAVGLANGTNTRGIPGSGGNDTVIELVEQDTSALTPGYWVRRDGVTQKYVHASNVNAQEAQVVGTVRAILDANRFLLQQSGFVPPGTTGFSGFTDETVFFLSDTPGVMTNVPPTTNGYINKPLFVATGPDSGWVICLERGMVVGTPGPLPGGGSGSDTSIRTVNQPGNAFTKGQWVRVVGDMVYGLAQANTKANAQSVGVVITPGNPNFTLQFDGHNAGAVTDAYDTSGVLIPGGITASTIYYLSDVVPGQLCPSPPIGQNSYSKPVYVSESKISGTGYILDQRPLAQPLDLPSPSPLVFLGYLDSSNNFSSETILTDSNGNTYGAYQIILHSGDEISASYGIKATGPNPINIGFQFFIDGAWQTTLGNYASYMQGVNSTAGVNTATMWAEVINAGITPGRDMAQILPAVSNSVGIISGNGILTASASATVLVGSWICVDLSNPTPIGYTAQGWGGCDAGDPVTGIAKGFRVAFGNGGTLVPNSASYFIIYGIPNS